MEKNKEKYESPVAGKVELDKDFLLMSGSPGSAWGNNLDALRDVFDSLTW